VACPNELIKLVILVGKLKPPIAHTSGIKEVNIEYGIVIILIKNIKVLITPIKELIIVVKKLLFVKLLYGLLNLFLK